MGSIKPGSLECRILIALAAGKTDSMISRELDCSERTVRRHVAIAAKALGAKTRFQAGMLWAAAITAVDIFDTTTDLDAP